MFRPLALAAFGALLAFPTAAFAKDAKVDAAHSGVVFQAHHFNAGYTWGRFNAFNGTVALDGKVLKGITLNVKADSVDTNVEKRDKHLRSPDFFDSASFPEITFKSTKVTPGPDGVYDVTGDLTLHGVTKPITTKVRFTGEADLPAMMGGGHVTGWDTRFEISQKDFGMAYDAVGDVLIIHVSLEAKD